MSVFGGSNNRGRDGGSSLPPAPQPQSQNGKRGMFSVLGTDVVITGNIAATASVAAMGGRGKAGGRGSVIRP